MLRGCRGGHWEQVANGADGILFLTPPEFLTPWESEGDGEGSDLAWLLGLGHFAEDGALSVADQRALLRTWIVHLFLPALSPVHPSLSTRGSRGAGRVSWGSSSGAG